MRPLALLLLFAACGESGSEIDVEVCYFASGRPCRAGEVCLGGQGNECNYAMCSTANGEARLVGTQIACSELQPFEDVPGAPFNCDPADIVGETPPRTPCGLGGLWTVTENGFWGQCVHASQCLPLRCDPAFGDEGCVVGYYCDAGTRTCQQD